MWSFEQSQNSVLPSAFEEPFRVTLIYHRLLNHSPTFFQLNVSIKLGMSDENFFPISDIIIIKMY